MEKLEKQGARHNAELVNALFEMMFETVWASPARRWRNLDAFKRFEARSRHLVVLLATTDLAAAEDTRQQEVQKTVEELSASIDELSQEGLILKSRVEPMVQVIRLIRRAVEEAVNKSVV